MILRNPNFGNTYTVAPNVVVRLSVDGDVRTARFNAPTVSRQGLTLSALTEAQKDALKWFFLGNAGVQFVYKTFLNTTINCIIIDDEINFVKTGSGCQYEVSLTIEEIP